MELSTEDVYIKIPTVFSITLNSKNQILKHICPQGSQTKPLLDQMY